MLQSKGLLDFFSHLITNCGRWALCNQHYSIHHFIICFRRWWQWLRRSGIFHWGDERRGADTEEVDEGGVARPAMRSESWARKRKKTMLTLMRMRGKRKTSNSMQIKIRVILQENYGLIRALLLQAAVSCLISTVSCQFLKKQWKLLVVIQANAVWRH